MELYSEETRFTESKIDVSIVVPMHNECSNVKILVSEVSREMSLLKLSYEILLIDDGSSDTTWQEITKISNHQHQVSGIKLSRNFGHQQALLAGLNQANGDAVISMDADLQHPPSKLPELIKHWQKGSKIVYTRRCHQEKLSVFKRSTSNWFYKVFSWMTEVPIEEGSSDFRLLDRQVLTELFKFNDVTPFFRGAVKWLGFDDYSSVVDYELGTRHSGESTYTINKMIKFANSGIISFSTKPLIISIWIGIITSLLAFAELGYILSQFFLGHTVQGWASTVGIITLLFGILFILLGVIGLYLARIHAALQDRPKFIIDKKT
jgi:dolichol-phosphate mannosyltransferase